jgi:hypothetical protein
MIEAAAPAGTITQAFSSLPPQARHLQHAWLANLMWGLDVDCGPIQVSFGVDTDFLRGQPAGWASSRRPVAVV